MRTIAEVLLPADTNVDHELVKDGWCRRFRKNSSGNALQKGLENEARKARIRLWADPHAVPPWEWQKKSR